MAQNVGSASVGNASIVTMSSSSSVPTSSIQTAGHKISLAAVGAKALVSVSFATPASGYAASSHEIYHTANGGKTWAKVYTSADRILGMDTTYQPDGHIENVVAYTKTYLLWSTNGQKFHKQQLPTQASANGSINIQSVSLLPDASIWVVNHGKVWVSGGLDGALRMATPGAAIQSVAAIDDNTAYASSETAVYKTVNHGATWTKIYTPPLQKGKSSWKSEVQATGHHVAAYFHGGAVGMNQVAFILYQSNNGGKNWNAMVDEGYYAQAYGSPQVLVQKNVGAHPGPFDLLPNGNIVFTGTDVTTGTVFVTTFTPKGVATGPVQLTQISMDVVQGTLDVTAADKTHFFLVGGKDGKAVVAVSSNAGKTWHAD